MRLFRLRMIAGAACAILCILLASCSSMDRKIQGVSVKSGDNEPVTSLAILFVEPGWGLDPVSPLKETPLNLGYRLSRIPNDVKMRLAGERSAEFLNANGINAKYVGVFRQQIDLKGLLREWTAKGYHTLVFVPIGSTVTYKSGTPIGGSVRHRVTLYSKTLMPMLEFDDDFHAEGPNSDYYDAFAAGWMNALIDYGYVSRKTDKLIPPSYRDYTK